LKNINNFAVNWRLPNSNSSGSLCAMAHACCSLHA
jgi:hypothetical protein